VIILDTDVLTLIQRRSGEPYQRLVDWIDAHGDETVCSTVISYEEQMRGWLARIAQAQSPERQVYAYLKLRELATFFQRFPLLDYDQRAADRFAALRKQRLRIGTMDARIAAIALVHDALLVTGNRVDFERVPELRIASGLP
jgi:tRNA(fMet)-specific endonuclease VapC